MSGPFPPRLLRLAAILLATLASLLSTPARATPRVALQVTFAEASSPAPVPASPAPTDWQAALTAELTGLAPAVELVERAELARLWAERELSPLAPTTSAPTPLAVDRYLRFHRVAPARWIVEHIDAATGRALGSFAVEAADLAAAPRLAEAAARLLATPTPADPATTSPRLAVVESADAAGDASLFALAARLRAALADEGVVVLDRALAQEIAVEQNDAAKGFRAEPAGAARLLGLDHYLELSPRDARLVRVRDGVLLGLLPRSPVNPILEVNTLQRWALPLLGQSPAAASEYLPQVEVEALEPFYHGLAHHDAGRFAEAVAEFTRAYELNGRFREAYEWSARCHEALGLGETASALRRFLDTEFLENLAAPTGRVAPVDGLAFLGVDGPDLPAPTRDALSAAMASRLARRPELGLRLPEELKRLRLEYDWARLGAAASFAAPEPAFFTRLVLTAEALPASNGQNVILTLRDTLGLLPPERKSLILPAASALREETLARFFASWPAPQGPAPQRIAFPGPAPAPASGDFASLAEAVRKSASESEADADRLRLLLLDPGDPLAVVRRSPTADEPLVSFLEHGRREDAIRRLPPGSASRRWWELLRAVQYLDPCGPGDLYSGRVLPGRAELARIADANPSDGPGIAARYHLLFLDQAARPPDEISNRAETLRAELSAAPDFLADCRSDLDAELAGLARLARLAGSPAAADLDALDQFRSPTDPGVFRFRPDGHLSFAVEAYAISRHGFAGLRPEAASANARALLALNGRPDFRSGYTPALLIAHPRAPALTQHIVVRLSHSLRSHSMPAEGADNWAGRRDLALAGFAYALDQIEDAYATQTDPKALRHNATLAAGLLGVLGHPRLVEWLPADTHARTHARLSVAEAAARARVEFPRLFNPHTLNVPDLAPEIVRAANADDFRPHGIWVADAANIRALLLQREKAFDDPAKESTRRSWWWLAARWETEKAFSAPERAALLARPLEAILRSASPAPDDAELARRFELGLFFLQGRRLPDAERVLAPLTDLPVPAGASVARRTHVANALFRLAQIHQIAGRLPDALDTARRGLALAEGHTLPFHTGRLVYAYTEADLSAQLLRLLAELRHAPERLPLPPGVGFVLVPTPNGDNPLLTVYYRLPPPPPTGSAPASRVLLLCLSFNADPLEALASPGPWTRFADAHNLALVAARFHVSDREDRADHLFTHPRFASAWSGEAVLRALDAPALRDATDSSRLLVFGRVSGSGFASHLAAWRPDRVAAVALAHGNWGLASLPLPELPPLSAHRHIRYWIGANRWDNHEVPRNSPRFAYLQDFSARLRAADLSVEWAEFSFPGSTPSEDMEDSARAFLARQLSP